MADRVEVRFIGAEKMVAELERLERQKQDEIGPALYIEGEHIMTRSKRDFVPVDVGPLKSSGHVQQPERKAGEVSVTLAYGGASAPYALAVHEHPSDHSPPTWQGKAIEEINWNPPGRGPKYLEKPLREAMEGMAQRLADKLRF